jgi:hypothetical protein
MNGVTRPYVILAAICAFGIFSIGCHDKRPVIPFADLERRPTFVATVDVLHGGNPADTNFDDFYIAIGVHTQSGEKFFIGAYPSERESIAGFALTLQKGQTYEFPKAWVEYKAQVASETNRAAKGSTRTVP